MFIGLYSVTLTAMTWSSVDLVLKYVFPYEDRDTFRGSVSIFFYLTILLVVFNVELVCVFEKCFMKAQ